MRKLVSITRLSSLAEGRPRLVLGPRGERYVCVRRAGDVDVLDDRCPHEGHPLSMGSVRDGVLTCQWHNWKFDLATGRCLHGGESVRRLHAEVFDEEVFLDPARDESSARERAEGDLSAALVHGSIDGVVRNGLRVAALAGADAPYSVLGSVLASHAPWGAGEALVALESAMALRDAAVLSAAEALAVAGASVSHEVSGRSPRPLVEARVGSVDDAREFLLDLLEERRTEAVSRVLGLPATITAVGIGRTWLLPFASLKLWDRGSALARVSALCALAPKVTPAVSRALAASLAYALAWSVAESDLPAWRSTRQGLLDARSIQAGRAPLDAPRAEALARDALVSEAQGVRAALDALRAQTDPAEVLRAVAGGALERMRRYDVSRSRRVGSTVQGVDVARAAVFCRAALSLAPSPYGAAHAVLAAGMVGKLRRHDVRDASADASGPRPSVRPPAPGESARRFPGVTAFATALVERDVHAVREALRLWPGLDDEANGRRALAALVRFCALETRGAYGPSVAQAASTAHAVWALAERNPGWSSLAARGLARVLVDDAPQGLGRVAATATEVVAKGAVIDD